MLVVAAMLFCFTRDVELSQKSIHINGILNSWSWSFNWSCVAASSALDNLLDLILHALSVDAALCKAIDKLLLDAINDITGNLFTIERLSDALSEALDDHVDVVTAVLATNVQLADDCVAGHRFVDQLIAAHGLRQVHVGDCGLKNALEDIFGVWQVAHGGGVR